MPRAEHGPVCRYVLTHWSTALSTYYSLFWTENSGKWLMLNVFLPTGNSGGKRYCYFLPWELRRSSLQLPSHVGPRQYFGGSNHSLCVCFSMAGESRNTDKYKLTVPPRKEEESHTCIPHCLQLCQSGYKLHDTGKEPKSPWSCQK